MYYGSEKQLWINDVVADFNSRKMIACDGPITVKATPIGSGDSMQQILAGKIQPDIWSPAGRVWLTLLDSMWLEKYGSHIISTGASDTPPLVNSPVVIAMWKSEAAALGWPDQPIGWAQIDKLSTGGWATLGHPELTARFGDFKFGHTLPDLSNSGLDAVLAEYKCAVTGSAAWPQSPEDTRPDQCYHRLLQYAPLRYHRPAGESPRGLI
jgi:Ca-activated chloride channel family protein